MPNNFEKQVKEKMDELTFVPTAPVWEEIQKQIRAKKERRRFLLWLPLLVLVTGTGTWLLRNRQVNKVEHTTVDIKKHQMKEVDRSPVTVQEVIREKEDVQGPGRSADAGIALNNKSRKITDKKATHFDYSKLGNGYNTSNRVILENKLKAQYADNLLEEGQGIYQNERENKKLAVSYLPGHLLDPPLFTLLGDSIKARKIVRDTSFIDSSLVTSKELKRYHWQTGITASAGYSGISKSFDVFPASLQADAGAINGNYNGYRYVSSPVNKNIAFSIGLETKKQHSSRISFAIGIAYSYYSTSIKVGPEKLQDTVLGSNKSVNRFYLGYGSNLHNYSNQYHYISLPLSMAWKVSSNIPVYLEGSFSVNQMIYTNALIFDGRTGIYYADKSVFNKTQLLTGLGVSFGLLRSSLFIGPHAQYGLLRIEKNGSSNHLVYAGLQAHYFFKK
jgi:hypothetical protein